MSFEEKQQWSYGSVSLISYLVYVVWLLNEAQGAPLAQTSYVGIMVTTIVGAIILGIVITIVISAISPKEAGKSDQRDKEIKRMGDYIGQSFVIVGAVSGLIFAWLEADYFWIANVIYLCFVLSALLSTTAKLVAYRRGFVGW